MNKRLYYNARVIHNAVAQEYNVEYKKNWLSQWRHHKMYSYSSFSEHNSDQYLKDLKELKLKQAKEKANELVGLAVIYTAKAEY